MNKQEKMFASKVNRLRLEKEVFPLFASKVSRSKM